MPKPIPSFAVLLVAEFSLQSLLRLRPDLATKPVALLDGDRRRATIIALTATARTAGVVTGLTVPQALSRCSDLLLEQPNSNADDEASASLLAAASHLSPLVEDTDIGIVTADVTSLPPDQREPRLHAALTRLATLGLTATAGLANTPLLALYGARAALGDPSKNQVSSIKYQETEEQPLLVAEAETQPSGSASLKNETQSLRDGVHFFRPDPFPCPNDKAPLPSPQSEIIDRKSQILAITDAHEFLSPLPLQAADPEPDHIDILRLWGITTLGQLTALSKADVAQRLGPGGLALWERAAGQSTRPIQPLPPPQSFAAEMELEHLIESIEPLMFLLRRFIDRLCLDLQSVALAAAEIDLCLRLDDDKTHQRSIRLPEPTASADLLFRTLQSHLETVSTDSAIVAVRLDLFPTRPLHRQQGLFDTGLRDPHGFAETLARAAALLGSDQIGTPQLADTHRPDSATLAPPTTAENISTAPTPSLPALGIPLRRFRPPHPVRIELQSESPTPAFLWSETIRGEIQHHHGPWRANGDWWQSDQVWAREEWDIALGPPHPGLYRLSQTSTGWYLEGEYD
ncbi:MAG: hypothetical protein HOH58_10490 [Opitutaceae bacterium]|nr:hypothetical protein [Opitutaceae bacterium]